MEAFFGKLARTMLRGIRVASKAELKARLQQHLTELNADPGITGGDQGGSKDTRSGG